MGDVKLSVPLGLLIAPFGAGPLLWAVALAAATGLVHGLVLKRRGHKSYPAAPHMVVAGLFVTTALVLTELSQAFA
jgi:Ni/Fe-hydrogenase subunit HybB-like protein